MKARRKTNNSATRVGQVGEGAAHDGQGLDPSETRWLTILLQAGAAPKRCSCPQRNRNWRRERQSPTGRADKMLAILLLLLAVRTGAVDLVLTLPQDGELTVSVDLLNDEPPHRAGARACAELTSAGVLLDAVAVDACASVVAARLDARRARADDAAAGRSGSFWVPTWAPQRDDAAGRRGSLEAACAAVPGRAAVVAWMNATVPSRSVGAEIGVLEGEFSAVLLDSLRPAALHLVDMWRGDRLAKTKSAVAAAIDQAGLPLNVALFHRARSADALRKLDDVQLDWAYVDGGHDYETVLADLVLLEGRVKPGGILVGDDMRWTPLPYEPGLAYAERSSLDISGAPWPVDAAVESFARLFPRWSVLGVCHNQYVLQKDAVH